MRKKLVQLLLACLSSMLVLWPFQIMIGETGKAPRIIWRGELISLRLTLIEGRFHFYGPDLASLVEAGEHHLEKDFKEQMPTEPSWIPLRDFWEKLGRQVIWLPEMETIILQEVKKEIAGIPEEAKKVLEEGIADTGWLQADSPQGLYQHLLGYYTSSLVEELIPDILDFISEDTDWHSLYLLQDVELLDGADDWLLLRIRLMEISPSGEEILMGSGVIKMILTEEAFWKISGTIYEWGDQMGFGEKNRDQSH